MKAFDSAIVHCYRCDGPRLAIEEELQHCKACRWEIECNRLLSSRLAVAVAKLGPRATEVLTLIAERLAVGAERYGDDFERPKDWSKEALEEDLDATVYRTVRMLK